MGTIKLTQEFKEFLRLLNLETIEYLLIGGYALALYGYLRPTRNMDVWIDALVKFGFAPNQFRNEQFGGPQTVLRMGMPPNRIEIITAISGVRFPACYPRRIMTDIDGVNVPVIPYDDLKRNKSASNRPSDRADVGRLEKARRGGKTP